MTKKISNAGNSLRYNISSETDKRSKFYTFFTEGTRRRRRVFAIMDFKFVLFIFPFYFSKEKKKKNALKKKKTRRVAMRFRKTLFCLKYIAKRRFSGYQHYGFVLLGAPGVGKGTFSKGMSKEFDAKVITSGDLLRRASQDSKDTERGRYLQQCIASGELVPDHIVLPMVVDQLRDQTKSFILDGFPRTLHQAQRINAEYHFDLAIYFTLPDSVLIQKMLGRRVCVHCGRTFNIASINQGDIVMPSMRPQKDGTCDDCGHSLDVRVDDTSEVVLQRLELFHEVTSPIVSFYKEKGNLLEFEIKTDDFFFFWFVYLFYFFFFFTFRFFTKSLLFGFLFQTFIILYFTKKKKKKKCKHKCKKKTNLLQY
ncbi:hypothetical protein RFI_24080 [Reticulomyxa filosa]|uniref:Adenylate kinase active site lid domain-containing protein n=1 Tax=Reticulomyxa filosa TaxID=46433 RepID=X6MHD2_RETFI|nr:hypothetical protein RFI_24080 [Reticulomyxa filosa]|eukprot:ETO13294.1 hypothetical protein RFI_24080 [Reticulomyxa filosa]